MKKTCTDLISDDTIYTVHNCIDLFKKIDMVTIKRNHVNYFNTAISFDIETSSFYDNETLSKAGCMYVWQVCFSGGIIMGREWHEFINLLFMLRNYYNLSAEKRMIIYVHNLAYEFQWLRKWLKWESVFALEERKVVRALSSLGIEFRCSYILTNKSLQKVAEDLPDKFNGISKLIGELDYQQIRSSETPLSDQELQYCINDVKIIVYLIYDKLLNENNIANIPLTATGYVRKAVRKNCLYNKADYARSWHYKKMIRKFTMSKDDYFMLKDAFQGGFTHASSLSSNKLLHNIGSIDFRSCYPAELLKEQYPMSTFKDVRVTTKEQFTTYIQKYACLFKLELIKVKSSVIYEHIISESRCQVCENPVIDNGRIVEADRIVTTITEQDYLLIRKYYTWEKMRIGSFKISIKGYLPTLFIESLLHFYEDKTRLKKISGKERDLALAKQMLNSMFGMAVTDPCKIDTIYEDDEWNEAEYSIDDKINQYNESKSRFLHFSWGVWCTAYARRDLLTAIHDEFKTDYVYADTDSIKFKNIDTHINWIKKYNESVQQKVEEAMRIQRLPIEMAAPANIDGEVQFIGFFDYEGKYDKFKTLGAKRYLTETSGELDLTCAGLSSAEAGEFISTQDDPFRFFSDDMYIPADFTGKLTHTYIDDETSGQQIDYLGKPFEYYEKSSVHLEPQDYSLSIGYTYARFLKGVKTYYENK